MPLNVLTYLNGCPECLTRGSHFLLTTRGRKHSARENIQVGRAVAAGPWRKIGMDLLQNWKRPLNWISRPGVIAMVIEPNCGVFT